MSPSSSSSSSWRVNLRPKSGEESRNSLPAPPGMSVKVEASTELDNVNMELVTERENAAKQSAAMQIAIAPGKALLQTAFMLWMSGSSIQIFSIYSTFNALTSPIKGILSIEAAFGRFSNDKGVDTSMPKLVFVGVQLVALSVALYKCHTMGLLPLTSIDWLGTLPEKIAAEVAGVPV